MEREYLVPTSEVAILKRSWKWLLVTLGILIDAVAALYVVGPVFGSTAQSAASPDELTWGKDPGLGVRDLQKAGHTGKGVTVAYIDQPIHLTHEQYSEADIHYDQVWTDDEGMRHSRSSMHGPAVVSLLLGKETGIAPDVTLYYVAMPSWRADQRAHADAIHKVIEQNKALPEGQRIRLITFSDAIDPSEANPEAFRKAVAEAEAEGIIVLTVDMADLRIGAATIAPLQQKMEPANYVREGWMNWSGTTDTLWVPTGGRTVATGVPEPKPDAYRFDRSRGLSWAMPYLAGTIALGLQEDPTLTRAEIIRYLLESGHPFKGGKGKLINPPGFVEMVKRSKDAATTPAKVVPLSAKPVMYDTLDDLISYSTLVVTGEVVDILPSRQPEKSPAPITEAVFKVDQVFKGEVTTPTLKVYQMGGRVGEFEFRIDSMRYYQQGERLLLFLTYAMDDLYTASSWVQGEHRLNGSDQVRFFGKVTGEVTLSELQERCAKVPDRSRKAPKS